MSPPGFLSIRVDPVLLAQARARAQAEDRTIASLGRLALRQYLGEDSDTHEDADQERKRATA